VEKKCINAYNLGRKGNVMAVKNYNFKVVIFGEPNVGKTTFSNNYLTHVSHVASMNIGIEFRVKDFTSSNYHIRLEFWILRARSRFHHLYPQLCTHAKAAILFYDITKQLRLDNLREWIQIIWEHAGNIPIALVGTKVDLAGLRVTSREEGIKAAEEFNLALFAEISAETGENIEKFFVALLNLIMEKEIDATS
jgi:small GTP-binding protein